MCSTAASGEARALGRYGTHIAHLLPSTRSLARLVIKLIKQAVATDENFVLIVTAEHARAVRRQLDLEGVCVAPGQLTIVDAHKLLPQVVADDDQLNADRLEAQVSQWLDEAKAAGRSGVRGFGEMVSLLHSAGRIEASERLEAFWNLQAERHPIGAHCGYVDDGPTGAELSEFLARTHEVVHRDSSRDRLIQAARELFAESYAATTTAAIARRAGSSESQMVKHFGGKEGLLLAVLESWWKDLLANAESSDDAGSAPRARLVQLMHCMIEAFRHDPDLSRVLLFEGWSARSAGQGPMISEGYRRFQELLRGILELAEEREELVPGLNLGAAREALVGATEGMARSLLISDLDLDRPGYGFADVETAMTMMVDTLMTPGARVS